MVCVTKYLMYKPKHHLRLYPTSVATTSTWLLVKHQSMPSRRISLFSKISTLHSSDLVGDCGSKALIIMALATVSVPMLILFRQSKPRTTTCNKVDCILNAQSPLVHIHASYHKLSFMISILNIFKGLLYIHYGGTYMPTLWKYS